MPGRTDYNKLWREKWRKVAKEVFGENCKICNSKNNVCFHRKDGKPHNRYLTCLQAIKNPDQYILLCYPCHKAVHWVMERFSWEWDNIEAKINNKGIISDL